jgi:hypothetical protein
LQALETKRDHELEAARRKRAYDRQNGLAGKDAGDPPEITASDVRKAVWGDFRGWLDHVRAKHGADSAEYISALEKRTSAFQQAVASLHARQAEERERRVQVRAADIAEQRTEASATEFNVRTMNATERVLYSKLRGFAPDVATTLARGKPEPEPTATEKRLRAAIAARDAEMQAREEERIRALPQFDGKAATAGEMCERLRTLGLDPNGYGFVPPRQTPEQRAKALPPGPEDMRRQAIERAEQSLRQKMRLAGARGQRLDVRALSEVEMDAYRRMRGLGGPSGSVTRATRVPSADGPTR